MYTEAINTRWRHEKDGKEKTQLDDARLLNNNNLFNLYSTFQGISKRFKAHTKYKSFRKPSLESSWLEWSSEGGGHAGRERNRSGFQANISFISPKYPSFGLCSYSKMNHQNCPLKCLGAMSMHTGYINA